MRRFALALLACLPVSAVTVTLTEGVPTTFVFGSISNPVYLPAIVIPDFEFTSLGPATLRITDAGYEGDAFRFTVDGMPYFTSRVAGASDETALSFAAEWADPHLDHGLVYVGPGNHAVTVELIAESFNTYVSNDAIGFIQFDEGVPEPATVAMLSSALAAFSLLRKRVRTAQAP